MKKTFLPHLLAVAGALTLALVQAPAMAFEHGHEEHFRLDSRHHLDHYYPAPGYFVHGLPAGAVSVGFRSDGYFFHGGVWYRPWGGGFRVVVPPFGIIVPVLPPAYVTLMVGGAPYYYANGVYYTMAPGGPGYAVVDAPPGVEGAAPVSMPAQPPAVPPVATRPEPVIYPRNGQSPAQLEADRQDCNRWATTQPSAMADASIFNRAVDACMDARGYTIR
ncbi:MAG: hypothetical protein JO370_18220 [Paucibacter sp.]|nr:hypothetical protein [Roseateles sp.]